MAKAKRSAGELPATKCDAAAADHICKQLARGRPLESICSDPGMPASENVRRWLLADDVFRGLYTQARDDSADWYADEIVTIADTEEDPNKARVRIDARKWVAAKLKPRKYGDRIELAGGEDLGLNAMGKVLDPLNAICAAMGNK